MKELVAGFPTQLREAKKIAERASVSKGSQICNILISGLGGSGIGGTIISELLINDCAVPIFVNKDYLIPAFVNEKTLVIVSSYSGNTEETISAMSEAMKKKAQIVCICSGGKILETAKQNQLEFIEIPGGKPPRSSLGYSLVQLMRVLSAKGFANETLISQIDDCATLLENESSHIQREARMIAEKLIHKIPVIYSLGSCEGVAVRFRQQINENSKMLCWHHSLPEMNHNELVGWTVKNDNIAVVTFHTSFDHERTRKRYDICKPIFEKYSSSVIDIFPKGKSKLEQFIYLINIGDWISCYIADIGGIDPVEVNVIDHLKSELSRF